jgi:hypothetical protein
MRDSNCVCVCVCVCIYIYDVETVLVRAFWLVPEGALQRTESISWAEHARSEEVLRRVKEETNILHKLDK